MTIFTMAIRKVIHRKLYKAKRLIINSQKALLNKNVLHVSFCLKSLVVQADLMLTGRLFQSRGAAVMKDRSPMVTFVRRFGVLRRIPLLFRRKS